MYNTDLSVIVSQELKEIADKDKDKPGFTPTLSDQNQVLVKTSFGGEYACLHPWECFVQAGDSGIVFGQTETYQTAFFEAFPGAFIRGEGGNIAEAEDAAWKLYQKQLTCQHSYIQRDPTSLDGKCSECGHIKKSIFSPSVNCEFKDCGQAAFYKHNNESLCLNHLKAKLLEIEEGNDNIVLAKSMAQAIAIYEELDAFKKMTDAEKFKLIQEDTTPCGRSPTAFMSTIPKIAIRKLKSEYDINLSLIDLIWINRQLMADYQLHRYQIFSTMYAFGMLDEDFLNEDSTQVSDKIASIILEASERFQQRVSRLDEP